MTDGAEKEPQIVVVPYEFAAHHRVIYADDATMNLKTDAVGTIMQLRFTRLETAPTGEEIPFAPTEDGAGLAQVGPANFVGTEPRKSVEIDVLLRPDIAFKIANAIVTRIKSLSEEQKERYRLPNIEIEVVEQTQEEK